MQQVALICRFHLTCFKGVNFTIYVQIHIAIQCYSGCTITKMAPPLALFWCHHKRWSCIVKLNLPFSFNVIMQHPTAQKIHVTQKGTYEVQLILKYNLC